MSNENTNTNNNKGLEYISAKELMAKDIPEPNIIVHNMIYQGLVVLASPPKTR